MGYGRFSHHVHLAGRAQGSKSTGDFCRHYSRAAVLLPQRKKRHEASPPGKIHARCPVRTVRRRAAEPPGTVGQNPLGRSPLCRTTCTVAARCGKACDQRCRRVFRAAATHSDGQIDRRRGPQGNPQTLAILAQRAGWIISRWIGLRRRFPEANPSASGWRAKSAAAWWACFTFWTSPRSACTRATTTGCSIRLPGCATWGTRWSSSSTTKTRCARPIMSSISAPARECAAAKWWHRVRSRRSPQRRVA